MNEIKSCIKCRKQSPTLRNKHIAKHWIRVRVTYSSGDTMVPRNEEGVFCQLCSRKVLKDLGFEFYNLRPEASSE